MLTMITHYDFLFGRYVHYQVQTATETRLIKRLILQWPWWDLRDALADGYFIEFK